MLPCPTRILFCRSNPVAPDPRVEKEARALAEAGYQVDVIGWDRSASLAVIEKRDGYNIHRIQIGAEYGTGMGNIFKLLTWQLLLLRWLLAHRRNFDAIHACDFDTVLPCMVLKFLFGKKLIYDIFDFYPDHLRHTPRWITNFIRRLDYWVINRVDAVILVDDFRRQQIKGTTPPQLSIIYNSPENSSFATESFETSPAGRLRLTYVGLFQRERGLLEMLGILAKHPEWSLEMAGFGGDEDEIYSASKKLPNVNWHGIVPYKQAIQLSSQADVLFATYDPSIPNHRYSSPNKLFEAMMLAKPIIVARDTNMDEIISRSDCGIVVSYGNVAELENALQQLAESPALRKRLGQNARVAYETLYDWDIMKSRLIRLYSLVLGQSDRTGAVG
jgi:glycosyltransferase involved in cell wall biosynthesis